MKRTLAMLVASALAGCTMPEPQPSPTPAAAPAQAGALLTWPNFLARPRPAPDRTIRYGSDERQVVDVYLPQTPGPHPVAVMIHGGCWSAPWDRTLMNWAAHDLKQRGIAVWNIDYRVIEDGNGWPHVFDDTFAAIHALAIEPVRSGDAELRRLDLNRVVAVGHSAGGHLGLWYAARRRSWAPPPNVRMIPPPQLDAVISLGGLPDLDLAERPPGSGCGTEVIGQLIGRGQPGRDNPFADTSVPLMGPLGVRQVLINGTEDRIIPTFFAEDYAGRCARRATTCGCGRSRAPAMSS